MKRPGTVTPPSPEETGDLLPLIIGDDVLRRLLLGACSAEELVQRPYRGVRLAAWVKEAAKPCLCLEGGTKLPAQVAAKLIPLTAGERLRWTFAIRDADAWSRNSQPLACAMRSRGLVPEDLSIALVCRPHACKLVELLSSRDVLAMTNILDLAAAPKSLRRTNGATEAEPRSRGDGTSVTS